MTKALTVLTLLAGSASAISLNFGDAAFKNNAALTTGLVASYDFTNSGNNIYSDYTLNVWDSATRSEVPGPFTITDNGYANAAAGSPYSTNMGSSFATGAFTINFDLISTAKNPNYAWGTILSMYSNNAGGQAGWSNALSIRNEGGDNTNLFLSLCDGGVAGFDGRTNNSAKIDTGINVNSTTPVTITVVSSANTLTLYIDGKVKGTVNDWNGSSLTGINFCGTLNGANRAGDTIIDNLSIWNTALDAAAVAAVTSTAVPEPATATLSMLALAGLLMRRRR